MRSEGRETGSNVHGALSDADREALAIGRTIQRATNRKIVECFSSATEDLLDQIRKIIADAPLATRLCRAIDRHHL